MEGSHLKHQTIGFPDHYCTCLAHLFEHPYEGSDVDVVIGLRRAYVIRVGGDELGPVAERLVGLVDLIVRDRTVERQVHDIGIFIHYVHAGGPDLLDDIRGSDHVDPLAGTLGEHEADSCDIRGEHVVHGDVETHPDQLPVIVIAAVGRIVGKEHERDAAALQI